jgi:citrate lyase subunit beta/citryl-CoA lyase
MRAAIDARTWLFVPGNAPQRFAKAVASGAEAVILDLEDSVRADDKNAARIAVADWLAHGGRAWVRLNDVRSEWFAADRDALVDSAGLCGVIVPKAEDPAELSAISRRLGGAPVVALVETAIGIHRAQDIAFAEGVGRLAFGSLDLAADLGADECDDALLLARTSLVLASRVAGLPGPIDGVSTGFRDIDAVATAAGRSRSLGFRGRLCIHPAQVEPTARALAPRQQEIGWARGVLRAADGSAGAVAGSDGMMIDRPVVERARRILQANELEGGS